MKNQPITAKIKRTTKGGMVTQPILNMGAPVKMKMSAPAKQTKGEYTNISFADYRKSGLMKPEEAKFYKGSGTKRVKTSDLPPPPKPKQKKKSEYTNLSFADYRKSGLMKPEEAKLYRGGGTKRIKTSDLETKPTKEVKPAQKPKVSDAKPKRKKAAAAPTIKSIGIQPVSVETKLTGKIDTAIIKPKGKKVEPAKKQARQTKSIDKKLNKAKAARDAGNIKKAERKERAASKKAARIARRAAR